MPAIKPATRRRAMIAMSALVVLGVGGVASQAAFYDSTELAASGGVGTVVLSLTSGEQENEKSVELGKISAFEFSPGEHEVDSFYINYDGTLPADISMEAQSTGHEGLIDELQAAVSVGDDELYTGKLSGLEVSGLEVGPDSEDMLVVVLVELDENAGTSVQGKSALTTITVTATQQ